MKVLLLKITTFFIYLGSLFVYNFHKFIKGIKTEYNIRYGSKKSLKKSLNIYYKKDLLDQKKPIIIYFHGGGWASYSKSVYTTLCRNHDLAGVRREY